MKFQINFNAIFFLVFFTSLPAAVKLPPKDFDNRLRETIETSLKNKNLIPFKTVTQNDATDIAKNIVDTYLKKGTVQTNFEFRDVEILSRNFMLLTKIVQDTLKSYKKNQTIRLVSLGSGQLGYEFLLLTCLYNKGFTSLEFIGIDIIYHPEKTQSLEFKKIEKEFKTSDIPVSLDKEMKNNKGIGIFGYYDAYEYIRDYYKKKKQKNDIFLMIQPGGHARGTFELKEVLEDIKNSKATPNYLRLRIDFSKDLEMYFPYSLNDFFVKSKQFDKETEQKIILFIKQQKNVPLYQRSLMSKLLTTFDNDLDFPFMTIDENIELMFYDLIKHTARNAKNPIAYSSLYGKTKKYHNFNRSMHEIFETNQEPESESDSDSE